LELPANKRYLVNVGSVGQPRDRDPRAAFVVYDSVKRLVEIRRVAYPVERAQRRIVRAGRPSLLANRLAIGM
jgi:diadenosine tetraphosphatase ApaH/serine/threonine PP2A family protein phosphatase